MNVKDDEKMEMEDFLKIDKPTIEDFLELGAKAVEYDFSNDGTKSYPKGIYTYLAPSDNYKNKVGLEKFFAYMSVMHKRDIFKVISLDEQEKINSYGDVNDPDSNSQLLQEIYKILWDENGYLKNCKKIQGDTLNSTNTTLNALYKNYKEEIDKGNLKGRSSITLILKNKINKQDEAIMNKIIKNKDLENFVSMYHTIGNFMPIPYGCNCPRGNGQLHDYWDLTLLHIYNYYKEGNIEELKTILSKENDFVEVVKDYQEWLNSYGKKEDGWYNFVKKNYLESFVNTKSYDYKPKELWEGHFSGNVIPKGEQIIEYFVNAQNYISERGILMVKELNHRIKQLK